MASISRTSIIPKYAIHCGSIVSKYSSMGIISSSIVKNNKNINIYQKRFQSSDNDFSWLDDLDNSNSKNNNNKGGSTDFSFLNSNNDTNFGGGYGGNSGINFSRLGGNSGGGFKTRFAKQRIQWNEEHLTPFRKNFYQEDPAVTALTDDEVKNIRESSNMIVFGDNVPKPFKKFLQSGIPAPALAHLDKLGISEPSAIQQQGIPMALSGRDIVGISRTGSGKTLAYLLPAIIHIQAQPVVQRGEGPIGLVLAPTRELAIQIDNEIRKYVESNNHIQLKHCAVFGGADRHRQIRGLRESPDLLVATPGRLLDLLECGETNFKRCTYLVLDEADRMLDMGFRDDLETILSYVRPDRQVLMWSATWPKDIQNIANTYMSDPIRVQIGSTDLHANSDIHQSFRHISNPRLKFEAFMRDIQEISDANKKCLVFSNTKRGADSLEQQLMENGIRARAIHGDKTQNVRENIMNHFRHNRIQVLIATDVVARGIDIRDIEVVLVFDMPSNLEDYVHRIGRTARAGDKGISLAYVTNDDVMRLGRRLVTLLKKSNQTVPSWLEGAAF